MIPGIGYLITAGVVRLLKVDREMMRTIQSDLEIRRRNYRELNEYHETKNAPDASSVPLHSKELKHE